MEVINLYTSLARIVLPIVVLLNLAATLELPYRIFKKFGWFKSSAESALASRAGCVAASIGGILAMWVTLPDSWGTAVLSVLVFFSMQGLLIGYIGIIVRHNIQWLAPADVTTHVFRKFEAPVVSRNRRLSSLLFGWVPVLIFIALTVHAYTVV